MSAANPYSPVCAKWTTERCAVCRWVEDWDYNKIIICNRYSWWCLAPLVLYFTLFLRLPLCRCLTLIIDCITTLIFICRCQIAVHQECYGACAVQDLTTWLCRACESPQQKRECCLCPVKGIACIWNLCPIIYILFCFITFTSH